MSTLNRISGCEQAGRKADVVFIHGLGGDAFATWRHGKEDSTSWPHWLGQEFPEVGVWSVGYAASPTKWTRLFGWLSTRWRDAGHGTALPDRALQVLDLMVQHGLGQRPLFFICHSLGGLVAKQILRTSSDADAPRLKGVFANTRAVLFLATPHAGAELASLVDSFRKVFGATVTIEGLRAHDAHLRDLLQWYRNHAAGIQTATYYEQRDCLGVTIVNPTFANTGVGADPIGLDEDHISIAKPREHDAQVCGAARYLLRNFVLVPRAAPTVLTLPALEGLPQDPHTLDHLVYKKRYAYPGGHANALRLYGAGGVCLSESSVRITYAHELFRTPPELLAERDAWIEHKKREAEEKNKVFFNGPNTRLLWWRANPPDGPGSAAETDVLHLHLGPVGWYDFEGLNGALRDSLRPEVLAPYEYYVGISALVQDRDVRHSRLSNIMSNATTILTADRRIGYQARGVSVSSVAGKLTSAVAENTNRYLDDADPTDSRLLRNISAAPTDADDMYRPSGVPHPFAAVRRGIAEELSPRLREYLCPESIKLTGISFDLEELHPDLLFLVTINLTAKEIEQICREFPGKDWHEGDTAFVEPDYNKPELQAVLAQPSWVGSGKASLVRAIDVLNDI